jgi:hypothetical protein
MLTSKVIGNAVSVLVIAAPFFLGCDQAPTDTTVVSASGGVSVARPVVSPAKGNGGDVGRFTTIDYPGASQTFGWGINSAGDIVGSYKDGSSVEHGFLLCNGTFTSFDYPGANWTQGWGISPQGDIVGQYGLPDKTIHGFLLRNGTFTPIDIAGQPNTMLVKISPEGTIVGCYHVNNANGTTNLNTMYGFEMTAEGVVTSHPMARTMNNGVNPQGDIVGLYFDPATGQVLSSYLIRNGLVTTFQFEGSVATQAWDISPTGKVVGFHRSSLSGPLPQFHGFIMEQGEMTSFDVEGATQTRAYGISATGDIVGYYTSAGVNHAFLLTRRGPK